MIVSPIFRSVSLDNGQLSLMQWCGVNCQNLFFFYLSLLLVCICFSSLHLLDMSYDLGQEEADGETEADGQATDSTKEEKD